MPEYLIAGIAAAAIALMGLPIMIPILRGLKFGQTVREDGPQSHLAKSGTPTMGGCVFCVAMPGAMLLSGSVTVESALAIGLILAMGALGFLDDFLKIKRHSADGLSARQKMAGQIVFAALFATGLWLTRGGAVWLPFVDRHLDLGIFIIPLAAFVIIATANGVNFTDGVDGLCSGVTFLVAIAFFLLSLEWRMPQTARLAAALAGSCLGFLCFNLHPAKVFMGDTGSLSLGAAVAALALLTDTALLLPLLGVIYVAEVSSVILQVRYFKMTGGKRLFRMSPIHHHFELCGWNEMRVDLVFWLTTAIAAAAFLWIVI